MKCLEWLVLAGMLGCGVDYAYVPTTNATIVQNRTAAQYPIPTDAPRGTLQVLSYGIASLQPSSAHGAVERTLHLRAIIRNQDSASWTFDTRDQRVELEGAGPVTPQYAAVGSGAALTVTIPADGKRVVDLYFPLPPTMQHAAQLPAFDAILRVATERGTTTQRTDFERVSLEPPADVYSNGNGEMVWGSPYWSPGADAPR